MMAYYLDKLQADCWDKLKENYLVDYWVQR